MPLSRDQSEDRPTPIAAVVYVDGETHDMGRPWKVYDLRLNPSMRGIAGRRSYHNADLATAMAVHIETTRNYF